MVCLMYLDIANNIWIIRIYFDLRLHSVTRLTLATIHYEKPFLIIEMCKIALAAI